MKKEQQQTDLRNKTKT